MEENEAYLSKSIGAPDTPNPFDPKNSALPVIFGVEYLKKVLTRVRQNRLFVPMFAVLAFVVGYLLFVWIARLEGILVQPDPLIGLQERDLLYMALIEQTVLGIAIFILLAASRTYQLTLLLYAGFLAYHVQLITERMMQGEPLLVLLTPVFIYAFTGLLVTLGLLFNKKLGILFLFLSVLILAQHNTKLLFGKDMSPSGLFHYEASGALPEPTR